MKKTSICTVTGIHFCFLSIMFTSQALGQVEISKYDLTYDVNFDNQTLTCEAEVTFSSQQDTINFLLYRLLKAEKITNQLGEPIKFSQNVDVFDDWGKMQVNHISIFLNKNHEENLKLIFYYSGNLLGYSETGMNYVKDKIDPEFTILRPDALAYPIPGTPSIITLKSIIAQRFDYTVKVNVPNSHYVANPGRLMSKKQFDDMVEFVYISILPTFRIDVTISKYKVLEKDGLAIYYFSSDSIGAGNIYKSVVEANSYYNNWFGAKDISGYSIIEIPDGYGSQADVTGILQTSSAFEDPKLVYELYHELSHLWGIPSNDATPCRLESEGLAVFLQYLVQGKIENQPDRLNSAAQDIFTRLKSKFKSDSTLESTPIIQYGEKNMTNYSYSKGMLFYYVLYNTVGEEAFFDALKKVYANYGEKGSTTKEYTDFLIAFFNQEDVNRVINEWIYTDASSQKIIQSDSVKELFN